MADDEIRERLRVDASQVQADVAGIKRDAVQVENKLKQLNQKLQQQRQQLLQNEARARRMQLLTGDAGTSGFTSAVSKRMLETGRGLAFTMVASEVLRGLGLGTELQSAITGTLSGLATMGPMGALLGLAGGSISAIFTGWSKLRAEAEQMKATMENIEKTIQSLKERFEKEIEDEKKARDLADRREAELREKLDEENALAVVQIMAARRRR